MLAACSEPAKQAAKPAAAGGPRVRATVVEIKTTLQPSQRTSTHSIVIGDGVARSLAESQAWSLYDLRGNRVMQVDDIARTVRRDSVATLMQRRRTLLDGDAGQHLPKAEFAASNESRTILGISARESTIRMGEYVRKLWVGSHPRIPEQLYAMMQASEEASSLAPLTKSADESLLNLRGFPLEDHSVVPVGNKQIVVDRVVTAVREQDVPASLFEIPSGYKELPPLTALAPRPRPVVREPEPEPQPPPPPPVTETTATTDTTATTATTTETAAATTTTAPEEKKVKPAPKPAAKKPVVKKPVAKKPVAKKKAAPAPPKKKATAKPPAKKKKAPTKPAARPRRAS